MKDSTKQRGSPDNRHQSLIGLLPYSLPVHLLATVQGLEASYHLVTGLLTHKTNPDLCWKHNLSELSLMFMMSNQFSSYDVDLWDIGHVNFST